LVRVFVGTGVEVFVGEFVETLVGVNVWVVTGVGESVGTGVGVSGSLYKEIIKSSRYHRPVTDILPHCIYTPV